MIALKLLLLSYISVLLIGELFFLTPAAPAAPTPKNSPRVTILCYHKFSEGPPPDMYTVSRSAFREQLEYLQKNNYRVVPLDFALDLLGGKTPYPEGQRLVVVTVDDAHRSFYDIAYPLMKPYGYTATLYVPTQRIGEEKTWMHWEDLARLQKEGNLIASHTVDHPRLFAKHQNPRKPHYREWLNQQLGQSKETLEKKLGIRVKHFAHPYGIYTLQVLETLKNWGYASAATVNRGNNPLGQDPFRLKRTMIFSHHTLQDFIYALEQKPLPFIAYSPADGATVSGKELVISAKTEHKSLGITKVRLFLAHEQQKDFTFQQGTLKFKPADGLGEGPYIVEIHAEDEKGVSWGGSWLFFVQELEENPAGKAK